MKKIYLFIVLLFVSLGVLAKNLSANAQSTFIYGVSEQETYNYFDVITDESEKYNIKATMDYITSSYDYKTYTKVGVSCYFFTSTDESTSEIYYLSILSEYDSDKDLVDVTVFFAKDSDYDSSLCDYSSKEIIYECNYNPTSGEISTLYHEYGIFLPYSDFDYDSLICDITCGRMYFCSSDYEDDISDVIDDDFIFYVFDCIFARNYITFSPYSSYNYYYLVDFDCLETVAEIKSKIKGYDDTYGDVSSSLTVLYSEYDGENKQECGEYPLIFGINDSVRNSTYLKLIVRICDIDSPVIEKTQASIDVGMSKGDVTSDDILSCVEISDNDQITSVEVDLSNYTENKTTIGTYSVSVTAYDADENSTTATIDVNVVDNVAPTFTINTSTGRLYQYFTTQDEVSEEIIYSLITVTDNYDENPTVTITGLESIDYDNLVSAQYYVKFTAIDSAGNTATITLNIYITDEDYPTFNTSGLSSLIRLDPGLKLTKDEILEVLSPYVDCTKTVSTVESSYFDEDYPLDSYSFTVMYSDNTFETFTISFVDDDDISYEKTTTSTSSNTWLYAVISVSAVVLLACGIFIYKRLKKQS